MLDFLYLMSIAGADVLKASKRILIVDDEENAREALSKILVHDGYDVSSAANGVEALNKAFKASLAGDEDDFFVVHGIS